jgi:THO complex subunit 5
MVAPKKEMEVADHVDLNGLPVDFDPTNLNIAEIIKSPQNTRLYQAIQTLKTRFNELVDYQIAHPKTTKPTTREEIDKEKKVVREIVEKERQIRLQLSTVKALYRQGILRVREEKAKTADDRAVDDALILGLHNLKYEEQSLLSEIAAAENYE